MALQPFIRRGTRSNATARRLIAVSGSIAPSVLSSTIEDDSFTQPVLRCKADETKLLASVPLFEGQYFFLVRSKFEGRAYVLAKNLRAGGWICSSRDEHVKAMCIKKVECYLHALPSEVA